MYLDCPAVELWARAQISCLGDALDKALRNLEGCSDPLRSRAVLAGQRRILRVDEDVKNASFAAVRDGRAHNVQSLQSALVDDRGKGARMWIQERMQIAMAGGWVTGAQGGSFCIAADGSRFGNPAEETVAYAWWHQSSSTGGWLPVQASDVLERPGPLPTPMLASPNWCDKGCSISTVYSQAPPPKLKFDSPKPFRPRLNKRQNTSEHGHNTSKYGHNTSKYVKTRQNPSKWGLR